MITTAITQVKGFAQATCGDNGLFGFPTWYKYLKNVDPSGCSPGITGINDIWLVVLAIIEILLRVAILAAIIYVLVGSFRMITSRDNAENNAKARHTIFDALIGLTIAVAATAVVAFIAGRFQE
jgi:Type IV secretion system pilin